MFDFGPHRARRRPDLTPMIDVVFLLLVFFMLASRFGAEGQIAIGVPGAAAGYAGPPRLVDVSGEGVALNGVALAPEALAGALLALMQAPSDAIVLRPRDGADLQAMVAVMERLQAAGFTRLVLVE